MAALQPVPGSANPVRSGRRGSPARPVPMDGDDAEMFPLLQARDVARLLGVTAQHVHDCWVAGVMPYVLLDSPSAKDGGESTEGRRRRMRSDHLRQYVRDRSYTP